MVGEEERTDKSSLEHLQILAAQAGVAIDRALATECVQTLPTASRWRSSKVEESRLLLEKEEKRVGSGKMRRPRDGLCLRASRRWTRILLRPTLDANSSSILSPKDSLGVGRRHV